MIYLLCFGILALVATSCSSWRHATPIALPSHAIAEAQGAANPEIIFSSEQGICSHWWELFCDEQLNELILIAFARSPTLEIAQAHILLASANAERVRAALFPNIFWAADISRQKLSTTGVIPFGNVSVPLTPASAIPEYFTLYETSINLTYDFDIWGKNRSTLKAVLGEVQSKIADAAYARLALGISLAEVYFQLQIYYKRLAIAEQLVANKARYLELIGNRVQGSLDDARAFNSAAADLAAVRQAYMRIEATIAVAEHQLKTYLAGDFEEVFSKTDIVEKPLPCIPLPCELPLHLIAQRPDVMAQIWLIQSAGHLIDVAQVSFYPDFNISALFGFQTIHFRELFKWPSAYFNVDPAVNLPLFDGGVRLANLHASEVNYDLAIYKYNDLVLNAVKEVLDGISVLGSQEQQMQEFNQQFYYQQEILQLSEQRVMHSLGSELDYLISEAAMWLAQDRAVVALGETLRATLSLIRALGGGYEACYEG